MAKKVGKCINIECDNYKQPVEVEPGEEFVCPKCHQPLEEGASKPPIDPNPLVKWLIVGLLAVAAIGAVVYVVYATGSKKAKSADEETELTDPKDKGTDKSDPEPAGKSDSSQVEATGDNFEYTHEDSLLFFGENDANGARTTMKTDVKTDKAKPKTIARDPRPASANTPKKVANGKGTVNLGYGTYRGDLKNGKPHGYGKITYKKTTRIVPSKDFVANPGDTFEGEFRDGRISGIGYWSHDGNQTAVKP